MHEILANSQLPKAEMGFFMSADSGALTVCVCANCPRAERGCNPLCARAHCHGISVYVSIFQYMSVYISIYQYLSVYISIQCVYHAYCYAYCARALYIVRATVQALSS